MLIKKLKRLFSKWFCKDTRITEEVVIDIPKVEIKRLYPNDELSRYFGYDYYVNDKIILHQPTIGEIIRFGEERYFGVAQTLTCIPSDIKSVLADSGIDYMEISDFDLFISLSRGLSKEDTSIFFKDLDFTKFDVYLNKETDEKFLLDKENNIIFDRFAYVSISNYIRDINGFKMKVEKAFNEYTKEILIREDREKRERNKHKEFKSILQPLISSMVNSSGFKYKLKELDQVGICEFMDSVKRIEVINSSNMLLQGIYAGNVDSTKINKTELNWMRELKK